MIEQSTNSMITYFEVAVLLEYLIFMSYEIFVGVHSIISRFCKTLQCYLK